MSVKLPTPLQFCILLQTARERQWRERERMERYDERNVHHSFMSSANSRLTWRPTDISANAWWSVPYPPHHLCVCWLRTRSPWARHQIFSYWYHLEGQMLPMFFWKFNTHRSWNHFIAMLYSQLSGSNHPLTMTTSVSSEWPRKWGRGNVKSSNSGKNHPILINDPSKCLRKWVLLCFVCFMQTSLISRSPGVKRLQNLDHAQNHASPS